MEHRDVVIIGAGPTGLLLAAELALREVRVTVLERLPEPDDTIKAGSINVASAEILDRRGLLPGLAAIQQRFFERVRAFAGPALAAATMSGGGRAPAAGPAGPAAGPAASAARPAAPPAPSGFPVLGHFAGMFFRRDLVDQQDPLLAAHTAVAAGVAVPQHDLELLLAERCAELGVEIRRGVGVSGIRQTTGDDQSGTGAPAVVLTTTTEPTTTEPTTAELVADWVVAADGGRSAVRKQLGIPFDGTGPEMVGYQAIAEFQDASGLQRGWTWTPRGIYSCGPVPGRILVARFRPQPEDRDAPVSLDELQAVVREVTGVDVTLTGLVGRATRWTDNARQAATYRRGTVFLAGDAAHVHSPFSGQGLNLGLGDAVNLGWKLAATIAGTAPDGLLDTYDTERRPIAAWVLDWTRAQVALMRGDERTAQLRRVVGEELFTVPGVMDRVVALTAGVLQHYDVAPDAVEPVGSIVGDEPLADGSRIADHAHDGRFVLVDRSDDGRHASALAGLEARVATVTDVATPGGRPSVLVRPDGIVAWASTADEDVRTALGRWTTI